MFEEEIITEFYISGMMFYVIEKLGDEGYRKLYSKYDISMMSRKTEWLH